MVVGDLGVVELLASAGVGDVEAVVEVVGELGVVERDVAGAGVDLEAVELVGGEAGGVKLDERVERGGVEAVLGVAYE